MKYREKSSAKGDIEERREKSKLTVIELMRFCSSFRILCDGTPTSFDQIIGGENRSGEISER